MSKIGSNYTTTFLSEQFQQKNAKDVKNAKTKETAAQQAAAKQPKLSSAAQKLLDKLKKTHKDMDFMVADFNSTDEAKDILGRGTKEFSVLFSTEELEKMAADADYEKENMDKVQKAVDMAGKISEQFGADKDSDKGKLANVGISFNSDGTTTLFAELEKSTQQQRERIEASREKKAQERKQAESKSVTVQASTTDELIKKLNEVDWSKVKTEQKVPGEKFDLTV